MNGRTARQAIIWTYLVLAIPLLIASPAAAYLDPGTGSMVLQAIIGALAVGAATFSAFYARIKSWLKPGARAKKSS